MRQDIARNQGGMMAIEFKQNKNFRDLIDCIDENQIVIAHIDKPSGCLKTVSYESPGKLEQILTKMKELQGENV